MPTDYPSEQHALDDMFEMSVAALGRALRDGSPRHSSSPSGKSKKNDQRYLGRYVASPFEHLLASTKAKELATWQRDPAYQPYRRFFTWMQQQLDVDEAERSEDVARLREVLATVASLPPSS